MMREYDGGGGGCGNSSIWSKESRGGGGTSARAEVNLACRGDKVALTAPSTVPRGGRRASFLSSAIRSIVANIEGEAEGEGAAVVKRDEPEAATSALSNPQEVGACDSLVRQVLSSSSSSSSSAAPPRRSSAITIGSQGTTAEGGRLAQSLSKIEEEEWDELRKTIRGMNVVTTMGLQELVATYGDDDEDGDDRDGGGSRGGGVVGTTLDVPWEAAGGVGEPFNDNNNPIRRRSVLTVASEGNPRHTNKQFQRNLEKFLRTASQSDLLAFADEVEAEEDDSGERRSKYAPSGLFGNVSIALGLDEEIAAAAARATDAR